MTAERALHFAQAERERAAVVKLGEDLAPVGVELLVFKGIHLAYAIAKAPERRLCLDADVLILSGSLSRAAARIRALARWSLDDRNVSAYGVTLLETAAYIDLHARALPPKFGRFDVARTRARSVVMPDVFGPFVRVPDALDAAVLAVANFTKDMLGSVGNVHIEEDLKLLEERGGLTPPALVERLASHGLRRAGLLAFTNLAEWDPIWARYRDAFGAGFLERRAMATLSSAVPAVARRAEKLAFLAVRAVGDNPADALMSFALGTARLGRDFLRA